MGLSGSDAFSTCGESAPAEEDMEDSHVTVASTADSKAENERNFLESTGLDVRIWIARKDDHLLKKIIARELFSCVFTPSLSESWRLRLLSDSSQRGVRCSMGTWKCYASVLHNGEKAFVGYESSSKRWYRLPTHSYLLQAVGGEVREKGERVLGINWDFWDVSESLLWWTCEAQEPVVHIDINYIIAVTNPLTECWKQLPPRPDMHHPIRGHGVLEEGSETYKLILCSLGGNFFIVKVGCIPSSCDPGPVWWYDHLGSSGSEDAFLTCAPAKEDMEETHLTVSSTADSKGVMQGENEMNYLESTELNLRIWIALDDDLLEKIIARQLFSCQFQAPSLSKTLQIHRCLSDSRRGDVRCSMGSWKCYAPVLHNGKEVFVGYESSSKRWYRLPTHSYLLQAVGGKKREKMERGLGINHDSWDGSGSLLWWTCEAPELAVIKCTSTRGYDIYVTDAVIESEGWKQLPPRSDMHHPIRGHGVLEEGSKTYKLILCSLGGTCFIVKVGCVPL